MQWFHSILSPRYPRVMVEEGLQAVKQWLEASTQLEEGEAAEVGGRQGLARRLVDGRSSFSLGSFRLQSVGGGGGLVSVGAPLLPGRAWARLPLECG